MDRPEVEAPISGRPPLPRLVGRTCALRGRPANSARVPRPYLVVADSWPQIQTPRPFPGFRLFENVKGSDPEALPSGFSPEVWASWTTLTDGGARPAKKRKPENLGSANSRKVLKFCGNYENLTQTARGIPGKPYNRVYRKNTLFSSEIGYPNIIDEGRRFDFLGNSLAGKYPGRYPRNRRYTQMRGPLTRRVLDKLCSTKLNLLACESPWKTMAVLTTHSLHQRASDRPTGPAGCVCQDTPTRIPLHSAPQAACLPTE